MGCTHVADVLIIPALHPADRVIIGRSGCSHLRKVVDLIKGSSWVSSRRGALVFTKGGRRVVWQGNEKSFHDRIECALRDDRSSPAAVFWAELRAGNWSNDPYFQSPPDENQIHNAAKLLAHLRYIGENGCPPYRRCVNFLKDGIWEVKHGHHRIAYFDTAGKGSYEPKGRVEYRMAVDPEMDDDSWWYPEMDTILRLTNGWAKDGQKAPPEKIDLALRVREEDVDHDKQ